MVYYNDIHSTNGEERSVMELKKKDKAKRQVVVVVEVLKKQ